ncbi:MAG TPA: hypothetical protein VFZ34_25075 [Blastocatellia bacterium]|nr:hypothetical protein [Blastocatellia bacterium]
MKLETKRELNFMTETSWLTPTGKRVLVGVVCSLIVHLIGYGVFRYAPIAEMAFGIGQYQFVDEAYDRAILIDLKKPMRYPGDYIGFTTPTKTLDLDKLKEEEKKRQEALAAAKRQAEEAERRRAEQAKKQAAGQSDIAQKTEPEPTPTPTPTPKPTPSGFKPINTRPIREQMQRLYDLKQEGKLVFDEMNLKVGVSGAIKPDGSIANAKVFIPSGNPQIDRAALSIVDAVSEAKALGPLSQLSSLSMVLTIDAQRAQLVTVGFAPDAETAGALRVLAKLFLDNGKRIKAADPASMIFLDNIQLTQSSNRITATITVPRQVAKDTLAKSMAKKTEQ